MGWGIKKATPPWRQQVGGAPPPKAMPTPRTTLLTRDGRKMEANKKEANKGANNMEVNSDFSPVPPRPKWRGTTRTWIVGTDKSGAFKFEDFQDDEGEQASSSQPEACELPEANKMEANKMEADKKKANKEANNLEANSDFSRVPVIHNSQFIIHSSQFIIRSTHAPGNLKPKPGKDGIDSDLHRWGGGAKQKNQKDGTPSSGKRRAATPNRLCIR